MPDEIIANVEGEDVAIVAREREPSQGDRWIDTFLMLEVTRPPSYLDTVVSTLSARGWDVREQNEQPQADEPPARLLLARTPASEPRANLRLFDLDDYLSHGWSRPVVDSFSQVATDEGNGYFVAVVQPLNN